MSIYKLGIVAILLAMALGGSMAIVPAAVAGVSVGQKAPDFSVPDAITNDAVTLDSLLSQNKAVVLIFVSTQCPYSIGYNDRVKALTTKYGDLGVAVEGINSNATESDQEVTEYKWERHLNYQVLKDYNNVVADKYGATHTPEAYVIDGDGILVYHGRIDNNLDLAKVTTHDLSDALDEVLAGKPVLNPQTKAFGCSIKRVGMQ
jgi:peroxiredoxin